MSSSPYQVINISILINGSLIAYSKVNLNPSKKLASTFSITYHSNNVLTYFIMNLIIVNFCPFFIYLFDC